MIYIITKKDHSKSYHYLKKQAIKERAENLGATMEVMSNYKFNLIMNGKNKNIKKAI